MRPLDFFDLAVRRYPDRVGAIDGHEQWTYRELQLATHRIANALIGRGFKEQQRVAIYSRSDVLALTAAIGVMRAGGIFIPVNGAAAFDSNVSFLRRVNPEWVLHQEDADEVAHRLRESLGAHVEIVSFRGRHSTSLQEWLRTSSPAPPQDWADPTLNLDRVVTIVQSGGTTGLPKAVTIRNSAYTSYLEMYRRMLSYDDDLPVCLTTAQFTPGSLSMAVVMLTLGARQVVLPTFSAADALQWIEKFGVTHMWMSSTALSALVSHPNSHTRDLSSVRALIVGGSATSTQVLAQAVSLFGPHVHHTYGQVETGILAWFAAADIADSVRQSNVKRLGSCGRLNESMRVEIMASDGRLCGPAKTGEIVSRGRGVCEYDNDPEATLALRVHGWHHTGDVGHIDDDGFLFISGRIRELIVTAGCNVFPREVEQAISELPGVRECAVVGTSDSVLGEAVSAVIAVRRGQSLSPAEISLHCRRRLGAVKSPKIIEFWPDLPKTAAGKIDRLAIGDRLRASSQRA
jgi:acyl-coenzyme A synthetase/AMP-(fatty) acid ligase